MSLFYQHYSMHLTQVQVQSVHTIHSMPRQCKHSVHPRSIPLRENSCLCPSPTKPKTTTPLLTRFDLRIRLTGPIPYSAIPQTGIGAQLIFLSSKETGTGARPTPGDHSHRPPPGWVGGNNKQSARIYAHKQPNAAQLCHYSTSTIACT